MIHFGGRLTIGFGDAAACPSNPPPPPGYVVWKGAVPPELVQWAIALRDRIRTYPYGQQWTMVWNGASVMARKDFHSWTFKRSPDGSSKLVTGICLPGITLYRPQPTQGVSGLGTDNAKDPATAAPDPDLAVFSVPASAPPERTNWVLVALSGGALAAVAGLFALGVAAAGER